MQQETPTKRELAAALSRAREATLRLVEPVDDGQMVAQVSPIMSPLVWDLAHIGWFEELWLTRRVANDEPAHERFDDLYDAFRHPREERGVVDEGCAIGARHAEGHLRLLVDEHDGGVRRRVEFMVLVHVVLVGVVFGQFRSKRRRWARA